MIYVFDLDDTLANTAHRSDGFDFDNASDAEWDEYFLKCNKDTLIEPTSFLIQNFIKSGQFVEIWTGRNEIAKEKTIEWLDKHGIMYDQKTNNSLWRIRMRGLDNRMKNVDLKKMWAEEVGFENIALVVDDNEKICNMFTSKGVMCYNVKHPTNKGKIE